MINPLAGYTYIGPVQFSVTFSTGSGPGIAGLTSPNIGVKAGDLVSVVNSDTTHIYPVSNAVANSDGTVTFSVYYDATVSASVNFVANVSRPENNPLPTYLEI